MPSRKEDIRKPKFDDEDDDFEDDPTPHRQAWQLTQIELYRLHDVKNEQNADNFRELAGLFLSNHTYSSPVTVTCKEISYMKQGEAFFGLLSGELILFKTVRFELGHHVYRIEVAK